jgi:hypothetical protein
MDDLLISLFLFSTGVFLVMIFAKRQAEHPFGLLDTIQSYGIGAFFILGGAFVLIRFLYHLL